MAKVYGIHQLQFHKGMEGKGEEFEKFIVDEVAPAYLKGMGARVYLLKGVRGGRIAKYMLVLEFPSVEAFTRLFPLGPGEPTEETQKVLQAYAPLMEKFNSYVESSAWTDYVETGK